MLLSAGLPARQVLWLLLMVPGACALQLLLQWPLPACSRQTLLQTILLPSQEVLQPASGIVKPRCLKSAGCESGGWHRACSCSAAVSFSDMAVKHKGAPLARAIFVMWCGRGVLVCACSVLTQSLRQMLLARVRGRAVGVSFGWTNMAVLAFCAAQREADKGGKLSAY